VTIVNVLSMLSSRQEMSELVVAAIGAALQDVVICIPN
jgi:hypothetical protein